MSYVQVKSEPNTPSSHSKQCEDSGSPRSSQESRSDDFEASLVTSVFGTPPSCSTQTHCTVVEETPESQLKEYGSCSRNGFVSASKLMDNSSPWIEVPRPPCSSSPSPSLPSPSSRTRAQKRPPRQGRKLKDAGGVSCDPEVSTYSSEPHRPHVTTRKRERPTRTCSTKSRSSPKSSKYAKITDVENSPPHTSLSHRKELTSESPLRPPLGRPEEVVIIDDDDDDDVIVEAMVRSVQMAEDEAFARSLQEQFDREEQEQQLEQRRQQEMPLNGHHHHHHHPHPHHHHHHHHGHRYDPYGALGWMPAWSPMGSHSSFPFMPPPLADWQQAMFAEPPGRHAHRTRTRSGRSRRQAQHLPPDLFNDSQGNNYEALLAFEEGQGSAVPKNLLTKRQIERFPTNTFSPAQSAGKTECQICFCDYAEGEQLRMLPCLHDYHVTCIDRWLKENVTCPICRVDVSELAS